MAKYQWEAVKQRLMEAYGTQLLGGDFVVLEGSDAADTLGASITRAMPGSCYLERGVSPERITATVPRHLGLLGFSSRLGTRGGRKYLLVYLPGELSQQPETTTGKRKRIHGAPNHAQTIHGSTLTVDIMTWLREACDFPDTAHTLLFKTLHDGLTVDIHPHGQRLLLSRTEAMERAYEQLIRKVRKNEGLDGIIYFMYCLRDEKDVIRYVGKAEKRGTVNLLSANMNPKPHSDQFARWGCGHDWHVGGLSDSKFLGAVDVMEHAWVGPLFQTTNDGAVLREMMYFWASEWPTSTCCCPHGIEVSLRELEACLRLTLKALFGSDLLNVR